MDEAPDAPQPSRATTYRRGHDHFTDPIITITDNQLTLDWPPPYPSEAVVHRDVLVDLVTRANALAATVEADIAMLHPNDRLIIRARTPITAATAHEIRYTAERVLGPDRTLVLDATFDITIDRGAPGTPNDDSDAQLAAIAFHHQQTRI